MDARFRFRPMPAAQVPEEESRDRAADAGSHQGRRPAWTSAEPGALPIRWLDAQKHGAHRACEYKVHHPRACRAFAFQTTRGFVIVRIEDKTENDQQFNETMRSVEAAFGQFLKEGERYE